MEICAIDNEESMRRLSRNGKIPGRVPVGREVKHFRETVDKWIRENQVIPRQPTNPLQEEAKKRCEKNDHDWLLDERFEGIAYQVEKDIPQSGMEVLKTGYRYRRVCYFCGYSTTVANFPNL